MSALRIPVEFRQRLFSERRHVVRWEKRHPFWLKCHLRIYGHTASFKTPSRNGPMACRAASVLRLHHRFHQGLWPYGLIPAH